MFVSYVAHAQTFDARLERVADGDSMWVRDKNGRAIEVRIIGIDAPERRQAFGDASRNSLRTLLQRCDLRVNVVKPDTNGRSLARVHCNGVDAGLHQIASGLAWVYPFEKSIPTADRRRYEDAETRARREKKGVWSSKGAQPPWQFRRDQRQRRRP